MARPSKNILSTRAIARAALALVEEKGDFTIPGIAAALKVNPSSLYHHLPGGRAEIVRRMREELYSRIDLAALTSAETPAADRLASWMRQVREALAKTPAVIMVLVASPVQDSRTLAIYEALFVILRDAGVPADRRVAFSAMIDAVVLGSAVDAASPAPLWHPGGDDAPELGSAFVTENDDPSRTSRGLDLAITAVLDAVAAVTPVEA